RSYLFLKAKNAVFMRLVAFRKHLTSRNKREEITMKTIQETYKGILFCLLISIPAFLLGKQFEVVGGPVFAILIGMCLALIVKRSEPLQPGIKFTSKKILQYAVI